MQNTKDPGLLLGLGLAFELGFLIAIPAAVFGFLGAYVDKYLGSSPLFIIAGFIFAFVISAVAIVKKVKTIVQQQYGTETSPQKK